MSDDVKPDINKAKVRYGTVNKEYGFRLATTAPADDGPIWMVNLMSYRAKADYADAVSYTHLTLPTIYSV
mgnify:CR=1 FL=1